MEALRNNQTIRVAFLNSVLLLLFAAAWASDRWPHFATQAFLFAVTIVIAEVAVLWGISRVQQVRSAPSIAPSQALPTKPIPVSADAVIEHQGGFYGGGELLSPLAYRHQATRPSTWVYATAHMRNQRVHELARAAGEHTTILFVERWAAEHRRLPAELAQWKLHKHGEDSFTVVAGAFEIEIFHGRANIRVLDSSRVTVESETRGKRSKSASKDLSPAAYH